tara:strand:+ start:168 stop:938 length:771 start_codon:yes stop_codon:yes gene_type:complete
MKKISWYYKFIVFILKKKRNLDYLFTKKKKSLNEIFNYFGTDKGTNVINPYSKISEKKIGHGFGDFYEKYFKKFKNKKFNFLEIGTWEGASLASFHYYFERATIHGIDRNFKNRYSSKRLEFIYCDTTNSSDLKNLKKRFKKKKFKIIIDDGSHMLNDIIHNLNFFFKFLDKGGYYVIEDFNHPKYFKYLNDSKNKELFIGEIIENLRKKRFFKSKILSKKDQKFLWKNIKKFNLHKGRMLKSKKNISDIVFLKKI